MKEEDENKYMNFEQLYMLQGIKILHVLSIIGILFTCIFWMYSFSNWSPFYIVAIILIGLVSYLISRLSLEFMIIVYKIYQKLK